MVLPVVPISARRSFSGWLIPRLLVVLWVDWGSAGWLFGSMWSCLGLQSSRPSTRLRHPRWLTHLWQELLVGLVEESCLWVSAWDWEGTRASRLKNQALEWDRRETKLEANFQNVGYQGRLEGWSSLNLGGAGHFFLHRVLVPSLSSGFSMYFCQQSR